MSPDTTAYWSTIAQLIPFFGGAVLLEARRVILNAGNLPRVIRAAQGIVLTAAALALVQSLNQALRELSSPTTSFFWAGFVTPLLVNVATVLILNPIIELALAANADTAGVLAYALRHPIGGPRGLIGYRRLKRRVRRGVRDALARSEAADEALRQAQALARTAAGHATWWKTVAQLHPDELAAAMAQHPPPPELAGRTVEALTAEAEAIERESWGAVEKTAAAALSLRDSLVEWVDVLTEVEAVGVNFSAQSKEFVQRNLDQLREKFEATARLPQ